MFGVRGHRFQEAGTLTIVMINKSLKDHLMGKIKIAGDDAIGRPRPTGLTPSLPS